MELIQYDKLWKNIVLPELVENDEIFTMFEKNDFQYKKGKFFKMDLLEENKFFTGRPLEECKVLIKKEFVDTLTKLITENCSLDIQDLISLIVTTDTLITKNSGEVYKNKIYTVSIQYCRLWWIKKATYYTIVWFIVLLGIISTLYFVL